MKRLSFDVRIKMSMVNPVSDSHSPMNGKNGISKKKAASLTCPRLLIKKYSINAQADPSSW